MASLPCCFTKSYIWIRMWQATSCPAEPVCCWFAICRWCNNRQRPRQATLLYLGSGPVSIYLRLYMLPLLFAHFLHWCNCTAGVPSRHSTIHIACWAAISNQHDLAARVVQKDCQCHWQAALLSFVVVFCQTIRTLLPSADGAIVLPVSLAGSPPFTGLLDLSAASSRLLAAFVLMLCALCRWCSKLADSAPFIGLFHLSAATSILKCCLCCFAIRRWRDCTASVSGGQPTSHRAAGPVSCHQRLTCCLCVGALRLLQVLQ
jgi:hypothetical protein